MVAGAHVVLADWRGRLARVCAAYYFIVKVCIQRAGWMHGLPGKTDNNEGNELDMWPTPLVMEYWVAPLVLRDIITYIL